MEREDARVASWLIQTCEPGYGTPRGARIWHGWLDGRTPLHLISAVCTALADPASLPRGWLDRTAPYGVAQTYSLLTPEQVVEAHTIRLDTIRTTVRATRRRQRQTPAQAPSTHSPNPAEVPRTPAARSTASGAAHARR